jgi:EAL domain-containing protein (putative c-di-GMP-specific phosphodiesterase class I)
VIEAKTLAHIWIDWAKRTGFPLDRIIFEFTEDEKLDTKHVLNILRTYRKIGFKTAIDDFGAAYAGSALLMLEDLEIEVICEGVETRSELETLQDHERQTAMARIVEPMFPATTCIMSAPGARLFRSPSRPSTCTKARLIRT